MADVSWVTYDGSGRSADAYADLIAAVSESEEGSSLVGTDASLSLVAETSEGTEENINGQESSVEVHAETSEGTEENATGTDSNLILSSSTSETEEGPSATGTDSNVEIITQSVESAHLKPTHRWQMPLPRNLLSDPENFDPATTAWGIFRDSLDLAYDGVVDNVGPNGESADKFTSSNDNGGLICHDAPTPVDVATGGVYVRAVSGTLNVTLNNPGDKSVTLDTSWQWVSDTGTNEDKINFSPDENGSFYILRAGFNRGSTLEYSTRSAVPQTIPDVIQGADLTNGTQSGPDTADLDFGVDQGVPYAVSDGGDETSTLPQDATETWATRVYIPASVGGDVEFLGDTSYSYPTLVYDDGNGDLRLRYKDSGGTTQQGPQVSTTEGAWHSVVFTVDGSDLRLHVGGTVDGQAGTDLSITADPRLLGTQSGARVQHPEQHPVLSEAEAEAVRQRLATNPADPIPVTEAWNFTAETSPHNLVKNSEDFGANSWEKRLTVNQDAAIAPDGQTTADELIEDGTDSFQIVLSQNRFVSSGRRGTAAVYLKKNTRVWAQVALAGLPYSPNARAWFDLDNGVLGQSNSTVDNYGMSEVGSGWYRCWVQATADSNEDTNINFGPTSGDGVGSYQGDGSSSIYAWGAQRVRGYGGPPPYVQTGSSIAFPQTVPALRQSSNDLTLGTLSGPDTADPDWVAPIGLAHDGVDDELTAPSRRPQMTRIHRVKSSQGPLMGRSANGWKVTATDLVAEDTQNNTVSTAHSETIDDDSFHMLSVTVDEIQDEIRLYVDGSSTATATLDISGIGTLKSSDVNLPPVDGTVTHAPYMTRILTGTEIGYASQRIIDNPQDAFPQYTNP